MHPAAAEQRSFRWQVPGRRLAVDLKLDVVEWIEAEARHGLEVEGRGVEVGGILLGRVRRERGLTVVEVDGVQPLACEHAAGPSFMLSARDRLALEAALKQRKGSAVGFYRSSTRREFAVTMEDVALMSWYFGRGSDVFLLVDALRKEAFRAAFVTWAGRSLGPKSGLDEFPFSGAALSGRSSAIATPAAIPADAPAPRTHHRVEGRWVAVGVVAAGVLVGAALDSVRPRPPEAVAPAAVERALLPVVERSPAAPPPPEVVEEPILAPRTAAPDPEPIAAPPVQTADRQVIEFTPPPARLAAPQPLPELPAVAAPVVATAAFAPPITAAPLPPPKVDAAPAVEAPEATVSVAVDSGSRARALRYVPPTAVRQERPRAPRELQQRISRDVGIDVRVYIDPSGKVRYAELLSDGTGEHRELAALAVFASRRWEFAPATRNGKPVEAQAVLRFRFAPR